LAGLILWDVKERYGNERAAARVFDVVEEEAEDGWFVTVGDGRIDPPTAPEMLFEEPCLGVCCRRSCRAFARAFSCVRTKWAKFCRKDISSVVVKIG
jgi:hypothetical protein